MGQIGSWKGAPISEEVWLSSETGIPKLKGISSGEAQGGLGRLNVGLCKFSERCLVRLHQFAISLGVATPPSSQAYCRHRHSLWSEFLSLSEFGWYLVWTSICPNFDLSELSNHGWPWLSDLGFQWKSENFSCQSKKLWWDPSISRTTSISTSSCIMCAWIAKLTNIYLVLNLLSSPCSCNIISYLNDREESWYTVQMWRDFRSEQQAWTTTWNPEDNLFFEKFDCHTCQWSRNLSI